jgi:magnesium chelatase subunit I
MGSHQMNERQVLEALVATAIKSVFHQYVEDFGLGEIAEIFSKGVRIEVGDMLPSSAYAERLKIVPTAWDKAFEVNASDNEAVRASCVEFVLAGLYSLDKISRAQKHGKLHYEV